MKSDQSILVLGVGGFVGSAIASKLRDNYRVIGVSRSRRTELESDTHILDLTTATGQQSLTRICEDSTISLIIDAASSGVTPSHRNAHTLTQLSDLALSVISTSCAFNLPVIHFSTVAIHERRFSEDPYVVGKANVAALFHDFLDRDGLGAMIYTPRIFGPNEPRGRLLSDMVRAMRMGEEFVIRDRTLRRSFVSLSDIANFTAELPRLFLGSGLPASLSIPLSFSATIEDVGASIFRVGRRKGFDGTIRFEEHQPQITSDDCSDERIFRTSLFGRLAHGALSLAFPSIEADGPALDARFEELF